MAETQNAWFLSNGYHKGEVVGKSTKESPEQPACMTYMPLCCSFLLTNFKSGCAVSLRHKFVRWIEIDACSNVFADRPAGPAGLNAGHAGLLIGKNTPKAAMADLLLDDGQRDLVEVDAVHDLPPENRSS